MSDLNEKGGVFILLSQKQKLIDQQFRENLYSSPIFYVDESDLPPAVRRIKIPSDPFKGLTFDPNKVSRYVFEQETFLDAILWRLVNKRINHKLIVGETGEGKTSVCIALAELLTLIKRALAQEGIVSKKALKIRFNISSNPQEEFSNLKLGQFESMRSQLVYKYFRAYEEAMYDEFELQANVMRASSTQNVDCKNTLDAGRFKYVPFNCISPSLGAIDRGITSTRMQWLIVAEFNNHHDRIVECIIKYCVHSRDNFEYRWVTFCEIEIEWCTAEDYRKAQELKRKMVETYEGLKSAKKHLAEQYEDIAKEQKLKRDNKAELIVALWKQGEISRKQCAYRIYNEVNASINYVANKIRSSWDTADKYIKEMEKQHESGTLTPDEAKIVEEYENEGD